MSKKKDKAEAEPEEGAPEVARLVSLKDHPGARARVRRAKGMGGLVAFALVAYGSTKHGAGLPDALLRGVVAGVIGMHVTWMAAVMVARRILKAQTVAAVEHAIASRRAAAADRS